MVFIISAPSGSGKSTLVKMLLASLEGLDFSISYTTRAPRGAEKNGAEYHFVTREQFLAMRDRDELLEWAEVFGNFYGTGRAALERAEKRGHDAMCVLDLNPASSTHPEAGPLNGAPQMLEVSRDGRRIYVSNLLYSAVDAQFYPEGIRGWVAKVCWVRSKQLTACLCLVSRLLFCSA
jgi:DNA helicase HerA-like ATPase